MDEASIKFERLRVRSLQAQADVRKNSLEILLVRQKTDTAKLPAVKDQLFDDREAG